MTTLRQLNFGSRMTTRRACTLQSARMPLAVQRECRAEQAAPSICERVLNYTIELVGRWRYRLHNKAGVCKFSDPSTLRGLAKLHALSDAGTLFYVGIAQQPKIALRPLSQLTPVSARGARELTRSFRDR